MGSEKQTKNCNCVVSHRGENTLELGCCNKWVTLKDAVKNKKCIECDKQIFIFDTKENAKNNGV